MAGEDEAATGCLMGVKGVSVSIAAGWLTISSGLAIGSDGRVSKDYPVSICRAWENTPGPGPATSATWVGGVRRLLTLMAARMSFAGVVVRSLAGEAGTTRSVMSKDGRRQIDARE
jgi:hypothetical protein